MNWICSGEPHRPPPVACTGRVGPGGKVCVEPGPREGQPSRSEPLAGSVRESWIEEEPGALLPLPRGNERRGQEGSRSQVQGRELLHWEVLAAPKAASLQASLRGAGLGEQAALCEVWRPGLPASAWGHRCATGVRGSPGRPPSTFGCPRRRPSRAVPGGEGGGTGAPAPLADLCRPPCPALGASSRC